MEIERFDVGPRLSDMVKYNNTLYLAGQVPEDTTQDAKGQMTQVLGYVDALLARAGSDKTRILSVQIYLPDMADFEGMNAAWDAWVPAGHTPARATVQAKLANPAWKVEIVVVAAA
ncbi:enamine deaminase RidA (YjgF/YER057c/UK114 family) [Chitinivorax tropicus]|uniref:Enamine deaminase RidA (YjgF/YER057c/UK114 family) n=1 Tax=Chitinivorax tropicus TaxID=714531 RepID=A0A840MT21_9PROT|nr:RidA family protein [Chitinivorax tropicus]MBB5018361.1 enamine deaminase RidA (YjgF/YER057c/UK114 family) [Chitinivorax tropicus]